MLITFSRSFFIQAAVGVPRSELAELWGFPQAWYIIAARSAVYIIKGGTSRPCISSRASVYFPAA